MRKLLMMVMGLFLLSVQLLAQNRVVTGKITDAQGIPLAGATVQIKNTSIGTVTNSDGTFSITVSGNNPVLVFSGANVTSQEISVGNRNTIDVRLQPGNDNLQEVVVVGYSTTTRQAFTGTAKSVSGEQLNNKAVANVSQALAGEVAGVRVINTSGQPGTSATIRIRGIGSVNGNRSPLYVVDGVPYSGAINSINPNDVATLTVLKDAAATSIYGSRGANGVIVITTKTGRSTRSFIEVDGRYGTNKSILPRYSVIESPEEYIALSWEALYNEGVARANADPTAFANTRLFSANGIDPRNNIWNVTTGAELIDPATRTVRPGVTRKYNPENWEDYAFQPSNRAEANIRIGGGDARTNYYTSFGYLEDKGYVIKSDFRRLNARINLNHEVKPWLSTIFNINYANAKTNNNGQAANSNSVFWFSDNIPPIYPLFLRDASGNLVPDPIFGGNQFDYGSTGRKFGSLTNAIADATYNTITNTRNELTGNTSINFKFTKELSLENRLGVQYYAQNFWSLTNKFYGSAATQNGSIGQTRDDLLNLNLLNLLRYSKRFGAHNIEALAAHEATKYKYTRASASGYNLVDNQTLELSNAIVINPTSTSYANTNRLESYFGQVNYDYESTYYVSGTLRRDGSSRFTAGNAWGTFGSVGLGWVMSKMNFLRNVKFIDYLKLKASYGILGDQDGLGLYPGSDRYDINNLNNNPSFTFVTKGNPDLTWETSKMFQTGVEFRLGSYLSGSVDYYVKNTDNLIFDRRVGPSNGYALITVNDGQLRNQGIEFELTGHLLKKRDYFLDLSVNGEHFTNKITRMPIDPSTSKEKIIDVQGNYGWATGHSIFDFYTRNFVGVDPADGTSTWTVYYDDANGNKAFDAGEQVANLEQFYSDNPNKRGALLTSTTKNYAQATLYYVGKSSLPKVRGAFNLNGGFKGIELDVQLLYSFGGYAYDGAYAGLMANGLIGGNNWSTDIKNRWQKPGDITDVPRLSNNYDANVASASTRFITKATYLALNNIRIGYNLPSTILQKIKGVQSASLFVSADNLWLMSERNGFNPSTAETGGSDTYRYSPLSTITVGIKARF
ncbi:MAG: SusC/RagA family TonB-linked outer membrane protein [Gammaproteobacteria bacterium]|nr:MAG: SusC/RagA family TonB-linked outer membrane protein [Gammaproteobacteria bacterium]